VARRFHARHDALIRCYGYALYNHRVRPALGARQLAWEWRPLDVRRMQRAARHLLGEHDFSSFRGSGCQASSPVRRIAQLTVERHGPMIFLVVQARSFLLHMVRNIVGVLLEVGSGRRPEDWTAGLLQARDRRLAADTAAAAGLCLLGVGYPRQFGLPPAMTGRQALDLLRWRAWRMEPE